MTEQEQSENLGEVLWHELRRPFRCYPGLIPFWDNEKEAARLRRKEARQPKLVSVKCERCGGAGGLANWSRVYGSKCFACNGSGWRTRSAKP